MRLVLLVERLEVEADAASRRAASLGRALSALGVHATWGVGELVGRAPEGEVQVLGGRGWRFSRAALSFLMSRSGSYDALWCPAGCSAAPAAVAAGWWNGVPAMLRFGGGYPDPEGFFFTWALRRAARFGPWVLAEDVSAARRMMGGGRLRCWEVVEGVDAGLFAPLGEAGRAARRQQLGLGPGVVLACPATGGLALKTVLDAWASASDGQGTLAVAGAAPATQTVPKGVRFVDGHELFKLYQAADAAVFPPGAPSTPMLEAMAAGLAVLAPGDRATLRWLDEGRTGYTYEPGYPAVLEAKLRELLSKPAKLAQIGREARAHVLKDHAYERLAQRYLEIYENRNVKGRVLPRAL